MNLPIQSYRLNEVAEAGMDLSRIRTGMESNGVPPVNAIGRCFAFDYQRLGEAAQGEGLSWHLWLLRRTIRGLWEEHSRNNAYVCYTLHPTMTRLFFCSRQKRHPEQFFKVITATPAYIESGRDAFPPMEARSLAYWEPPCTMVALWPRGLEGETEGARVVDAGNAVDYFSYPESQHAETIPVDEAGPDYVRVPQDEHAEFTAGDRVYRYLNPWDAGKMDLRMEG